MQAGSGNVPQTESVKAPLNVRWLVMQSLKYRKWVLAVIQGTFEEYHVTDVMSENVELIVQCADYLNRGVIGSGIDSVRRAQLDRLKEQYCG